MTRFPFFFIIKKNTAPIKNLATKLNIMKIVLFSIQLMEIYNNNPEIYKKNPSKINFFLAPSKFRYLPPIIEDNSHPIGNMLNIIPTIEAGMPL
jgi:hypothetical protein